MLKSEGLGVRVTTALLYIIFFCPSFSLFYPCLALAFASVACLLILLLLVLCFLGLYKI
jgi:hypothetical protein